MLLGGRITSDVGGARVVVRITEVEAYGGVGEDPGSHAFRRRTPRNATMFGRAGLAYVYFTYGMHWCLCVVTGPPDEASAVLVRAGEVIEGVDAARARRPGACDRDLARGPARLTVALGVTGEEDGESYEENYTFDMQVVGDDLNVTVYENLRAEDEVGGFSCNVAAARGQKFCVQPLDGSNGRVGNFSCVLN